MNFSTTENQIFIVELQEPFERLEVQFVPKDIPWSRNANLSAVEVVGRNHPKYHFTGGEDQVGLQLDFYSDEENREDVLRKVRWLQSLTYNDGYNAPARNVKIVFGRLFQKEIWAVANVNAVLSSFNSNYGMLPQRAMVDITFKLDPKTNLRLSDVRI